MAIKSIGIDIREANERAAGKGRYTTELTKALIQEAPEDIEIHLFTDKANKQFPSEGRVHQVVIKGKSLRWHFKLRQYLKKHPVDWMLCPSSYIYPAIAPKTQRVATVVHDLIAFLYPKHNHWFATLVEWLCLARSLKKSALIVTVSKHTWKDLEARYPWAKDKAHVVATNAVSKELHKVSTDRLKLPKKYLLAVGTIQPRKNYPLLLEAFKQLAQEDPELELVLIGAKGWKSSSFYRALPSELNDRIHLLGYLRQEELMEAYSKAAVFVYPSLYEGFGLPPLEAMACECPVVTSNASALPEVVGDAAFTVDPKDSEALKQAIQKLMESEWRKQAIALGKERVKQFSWTESAHRILAQIDPPSSTT